jgi:hypothetical protein
MNSRRVCSSTFPLRIFILLRHTHTHTHTYTKCTYKYFLTFELWRWGSFSTPLYCLLFKKRKKKYKIPISYLDEEFFGFKKCIFVSPVSALLENRSSSTSAVCVHYRNTIDLYCSCLYRQRASKLNPSYSIREANQSSLSHPTWGFTCHFPSHLVSIFYKHTYTHRQRQTDEQCVETKGGRDE